MYKSRFSHREKQKTPPIGGAFQKTAPGIPKTVLQEPNLNKEAAGLLAESQAILAGAFTQHGKRPGVVQAHHADEAFGVDLLKVVAHQDLEGLHRGHGDKFLHFLKRANGDPKFLHNFPLKAVQNRKKRV